MPPLISINRLLFNNIFLFLVFVRWVLMLSGMNHLTLAIQSLERSVTFYKDILGFRLAARWKNGAYLELGDLWLCLSLDDKRSNQPWPEYTHYAFSISEKDFLPFVAKLIQAGVAEWKNNSSEGNSFYFLDPDGHKLEIHVGSLESRLKQCREHPYADMEIFDLLLWGGSCHLESQ